MAAQSWMLAVSVDDVLAPHVYVFYAAFLISFIFTPILRTIALYYGIIDQPDRLRKMHSEPVAYLGGVAVFLGWLAGLAMSQLHLPQGDVQSPHLNVKISIVVGACAIVLLGLWDDLKHIKPRWKILGQVCAAVFLLLQGIGTHLLYNMIVPVDARLQILFHASHPVVPNWLTVGLSSIVTIFLVVSCCNATNLMDGLDGLCGGVTAIIVFGFLFLAVHLATRALAPDWDPVRIVLALALLGGVLGFIPYNFNPASIFMGDTGSMFLGYTCATMIILLAEQQSKWFLAALVMFALPVLDTSLAFARRYVNRRPFFSADRYHFHHQLVSRGLSIKQAVLVSYALAIFFCFLGALIVFMRTRYAVAFYLVIFGSLIVAAYKMGMVHETPRVVTRRSLTGEGQASAAPMIEPATVLEVRESDLSRAPGEMEAPSGVISVFPAGRS